ncbi:MAG: hypothetical protein K0R67_2946 [Paenibacillus sp.]|nr:hypothetical protein [Paenibacillus sp.]
MTSGLLESKNAVWLYLGNEVRSQEELNQFIDWCSRNNVGKVLIHLPARSSAVRVELQAQVAALTEVCILRGIEVHGMIGALIQRTSDTSELLFDDPSCYCVDAHGINNKEEPISGNAYVFDPGNPEVISIISDNCAALLGLFPGLAGIHLDFVRYYHFESSLTIDTKSAGHWLGSVPKPGHPLRIENAEGVRTTFFLEASTNLYNDPPIGDKLVLKRDYRYCFCEDCIQGFTALTGIQIPLERKSSTSEVSAWILEQHSEQWAAYRADLITALIRSIRATVQAAHPNAQLSATIWYNAPYGNELRQESLRPGSEYELFGQQWDNWIAEQLVDFLCPMDYWLEPASFAQIVTDQVLRAKQAAQEGTAVRIYPGILLSHEYPIPAEQLQLYQQAASDAGAAGMCYFHYGSWKSIL